MSTRSVLVPLNDTDNWEKLSDLIAAELTAEGMAQLPTICNTLTIASPETNAGGSRLEITSDPVNLDPAYSLLPEESKEFLASCYNNMSTMDKWIRLVDGAGNPIDGNARVILELG